MTSPTVPIPLGRAGSGDLEHGAFSSSSAANGGLFAMQIGSPIMGTPMGYLVRNQPAVRQSSQDANPGMLSSQQSTGPTHYARGFAVSPQQEPGSMMPTSVGFHVDSLGRRPSYIPPASPPSGGVVSTVRDKPHTSLLSTAHHQPPLSKRHSTDVGPFGLPQHNIQPPPPPPDEPTTRLSEPVIAVQGDTDLKQPLLAADTGWAMQQGQPYVFEQRAAGTKPQDAGTLKAVVFGLINSAVGLPALIAFAAIVFKSHLYAPYLGDLCKLFFLSSGVHQLVFVMCSSLPFAIGQVQDVGLIFLSAMATSIALDCHDAGLSSDMALGTALVTMSLSTLIVGLLTILVGRFQLAQLVQYVPLPVVGGYLGYVGYFCVAGGVGIGCSTQIDTLSTWVRLIDKNTALKLLPTLGTAAALMTTLEKCKHPLALPGVLLAIPLAFWAVVWAGGWSLQDVQDAGWVMQPTVGGRQYFWQLWEMFNLQNGLTGIYWTSVLAQLPKLVGLFLVVCFGSCMDVAAIQQDLPQPLDFNRELITVGISNTVVGAIGAGYTGSYIFSQTIFTLRAGVHNRLNGIIVALAEIAVFALPFSIVQVPEQTLNMGIMQNITTILFFLTLQLPVQYCPSFFFGALLLWFGIDISRDWLLLSIRKLSTSEFALLWLTFAFIMAMDLERGIASGVVASTLYFAYQYAKSQVTAVRVVAAGSGSMHSTELASVLELCRSRVVHCTLEGFIFFGSSTAISQAIEKIADRMVATTLDNYQSAYDLLQAQGLSAIKEARAAGKQTPAAGDTGTGVVSAEQLKAARATVALADAPLFLIINLRQVSHVDATGARTFGTLANSLASRGIHTVFIGIRPDSALRRLLAAHGILLQTAPPPPFSIKNMQENRPEEGINMTSPRFPPTTPAIEPQTLVNAPPNVAAMGDSPADDLELTPGVCLDFPTVESAMQYVEGCYAKLARQRGVLQQLPARFTLSHLLQRHSQEMSVPAYDLAAAGGALERYTEQLTLQQGQVLLSPGTPVHRLILVQEGALQLDLITTSPSTTATPVGSPGANYRYVEPQSLQRSCSYTQGCWVLVPEFCLQRASPGTVLCTAGPCTLLALSRSNLLKLMTEAPIAASMLQWALLKFSSLQLTESQDRAEGHHTETTS